MSFVKISVHAVWGTKYRERILTPDKRIIICDHIKQNASKKGIYIDTIDGYLDHLHCLMNLSSRYNISDQMQLIKGESSYWINQSKIFRGRFHWCSKFYAASVSEERINIVRKYIATQEKHHRLKSFSEECKELFPFAE